MSHQCPAPDCTSDRPVPGHLFACRTDWYRLPADIRRRIWDTAWTLGPDREDAVAAAIEHWATHPRGPRAGP